MRSALVAAALMAGALAVPHQKRDVVTNTDIDVVYATDIVTVTEGAPAPAATTKEAAKHWGHGGHGSPHWWSQPWSSAESSHQESEKKTKTTVTAPAPTTPAPTTPTSTWVAPTTTAKKPTTTAEKPPPSSTKEASTPAAVPTSYSEITVFSHNLHRKNHSAVDIQWSDDLASSAAGIAASCVYAHNVDYAGGGYGQNIAAGVEANNISAIITDLFYNGEVGFYADYYGEAQPPMTYFDNWGHFSQIVWKGTTHVGCATQDCTSQGLANVGDDVSPYFTVCNYKSPGNYANEYGANIGEPLGHPTAQWNTGLS